LFTMQLYHSLEELESLPAPLSYAIGVFDGLHSGHREVVEHALLESREDGSTVVITFDPHPLEVLAPEKAPRLLTSTVHKQQLLKRIGVEHLCVLPFTEEFAAKTAREFVDDLLKAGGKEGIASIWVGEEFLFGKGATGDVALMREVASRVIYWEGTTRFGGQLLRGDI